MSSDPPKESKVFFSKKKGKIYNFFQEGGWVYAKNKKEWVFFGGWDCFANIWCVGEIGQIAPELQTKQNL